MEDICRSGGARATADRIASRRKVGVSWRCLGCESACCTQRPRQPAGKKRWALVGGAWDASQPAVLNDRDSQLEKEVGVSWRCLG